MCVMVHSKNGDKLSKINFKNFWKINPHGMGMAYIKDGFVHVKKGIMNLEEAIDYYYNEFNENVEHILHMRYTSVGETSPLMTHPFIISDLNDNINSKLLTFRTKQPILFQYGTVSHYYYFSIITNYKRSYWSDTKLMSIQLAKNNYNYSVLKEINSKRQARFIVMSPNGIKRFGKFFEITKNIDITGMFR